MHRHAVRGFAVIPVLAALMILIVGCGSSGTSSTPKTSSSPTTSPSASSSATSSTSAAAAACRKIEATLGQAPSTLGQLALHPSSAKSQVTAFVTKLKEEAAASGSSALSSAVDQFTGSVQKALSSLQSNPSGVTSLISQLTKDSQKIVTACTHATSS